MIQLGILAVAIDPATEPSDDLPDLCASEFCGQDRDAERVQRFWRRGEVRDRGGVRSANDRCSWNQSGEPAHEFSARQHEMTMPGQGAARQSLFRRLRLPRLQLPMSRRTV